MASTAVSTSTAATSVPTVINYGHSGGNNSVAGAAYLGSSSAQVINIPRPSKSMLGYFCEKVVEKGRSVVIAEEMQTTWKFAGHDENSLYNFVNLANPSNKAKLRLLLVKELGNAPAGKIPLGVNVGELLDETVNYFMPVDRQKIVPTGLTGYYSNNPLATANIPPPPPPPPPSQQQPSMQQSSFNIDMQGYAQRQPSTSQGLSGNYNVNRMQQQPQQQTRQQQQQQTRQPQPNQSLVDSSNLKSALSAISSVEKFKKLDSLIEVGIKEDPDAFDGRLQSLKPLKHFVYRKMSVVSASFGVSDAYVQSVATTIPKLLAHVDLCLYDMQQMHQLYGPEPLTESLNEKLQPFADSFPKGVTVNYIASIVSDFLAESSRN